MTSPSTDRRLGLSGGQAFKVPVAAATTAAITLSGEQTIDGVLTSGSRVLVKDQIDTTTNGIYDTDTGSWTRSPDFDGTYDAVQGTLVYVAPAGSANGGLIFQLTTASPVIGTSALTFLPGAFSSIGSTSFIQSGTGAVAEVLQTEIRGLSMSPEQFGAAATYSLGTDDTSFVNACFAAAETAGRAVALRRLYSVSNVLFGSQATGSQSTSPAGMFGSGNETGFVARTGTTGIVLQAWSIAGIPWRDFIVDCNSVAGITKGIDTEWKPGTGPDTENRFQNIWVQNYAGIGWNNRNGNQSSFDGCVVRAPTGTNQTAFDCQGSGGQMVMQNCAWIGGILDLSCQTANLSGCVGPVRLNKDQTGDNVLQFDTHYFYPNATSTFFLWDNAPGTAGHLVREATLTACLFGPTADGQALFNIGLVGNMNVDGCIVEGNFTCNFFGAGANSKASGGISQVVLNGLTDFYSKLTLNAISGISYQRRMLDVAGTVTGDVGPRDATVQLNFGGGNNGMTTSTNACRYVVENGRCVGNITIVLTAKGSSTGAATITGLPVASRSVSPDSACLILPQVVTYTTIPAALIGTNSTSISLYKLASGGSVTALDDTMFADTSSLRVHFDYPVY